MPRTLPPSIIIALGLSAGCDACTDAAPTAEAPERHPAPDTSTDVRPRGRIDEPDEPTRVGPCLKIIPREDLDEADNPNITEPSPPPPVAPDGDGHGALEDARQRVLASGMLPEDVVDLLRQRQG